MIGVGGIAGGAANGTPTSIVINATLYTAAPGSSGAATGTAAANTPVFAQGGITQPGSSAVAIVRGDNGMPGAALGINGVGGNGGSGGFGIGGLGTPGNLGTGFPASGFGAGGGGAAGVDLLGGNGAPGIVIVEEYA